MSINITKVGGLVEIVDASGKMHLRSTNARVEADPETALDKISLTIGGIAFFGAITSITFGAVACTDYNDFKAKMALVFLSANSSSGGTTVTSLDSVPQGTTVKYMTAAEYTTLQQMIAAFTTT